MMTRNFTIYFRKTIVQKDEGLYSTPSTQQIKERITTFCAEKKIQIVSLVINDPFSDSTVKIRGTREQCDELFNFLNLFSFCSSDRVISINLSSSLLIVSYASSNLLRSYSEFLNFF